MSIFVNQISTTHFKSGDQLSLEKNHLWLIVSGVVKSYTVSEEGNFVTLGFWGTDDLLGRSLSQIAPYALKCLSEVSALAIPEERWQEVSRQMLNHAKQTQQLIYILRSPRIYNRLWLFLQWLADKFGRTIEQGRMIDFKLTHQELADAINTTRITVTKTLNQFENEGLILRPRTKCIILRS